MNKKRYFLLFVIATLSITRVFSQSWDVTKHEADDLKGTKEYISYMYSVPGVGSFVFWNNKENQYRIVSDDGIFNYEVVSSRYGTNRGLSVIVGLYDANDNLQERLTMWLDCESDKPTFLETRDMGALLNPMGQKKKVKKIMSHLKKATGYIRFVASRYGKTDFDLKVPCGELDF